MELLKAIVIWLVGVALAIAIMLAVGLHVDWLNAIVFGGIGMALSVAMNFGKRRGLREAEFGDRDNG